MNWLFEGTAVLVWQQLLVLFVAIALWAFLVWATGNYVRLKADLDIMAESYHHKADYLEQKHALLIEKEAQLRRKEAQLNVMAIEMGVETRDDAR